MGRKLQTVCRHCGSDSDWFFNRGRREGCNCRRRLATAKYNRGPKARLRRARCESAHPIRFRLRAIKARAACTLTEQDIADLGDSCAYCGRGVVWRSSDGSGLKPTSATIDRLMPDGPYSVENVVMACHECNTKKRDLTAEDMRNFADTIERLMIEKLGLVEA